MKTATINEYRVLEPTPIARSPQNRVAKRMIMSPGKFFKGPIPWDWLSLAARQPGRAIHVALAIWFLAGVTKGVTVQVTSKLVEELGADRHAKGRGLKALEKAGLIEIEGVHGKNPTVTILPMGNDSVSSSPLPMGATPAALGSSKTSLMVVKGD